MAVVEDFLAFQYQEIEKLDEEKKIYLVQDTVSGRIFQKRLIMHEEGWYSTLWQQMKHPNLLQTEAVYRMAECGMVIEEYVNGRSLHHLLQENGTCSVEEAKRYVRQICSALSEIHAGKLVYRGINPENIIITTGNNVKLLNCGALRETVPGKWQDTVFIGTPGYAAPEQFGFGQSDNRSDIYAVGILLNVMLTGHMPREKMYSGERSLQTIIRRCIQVDRNKRYQNVGEIVRELDKSAGGYYIAKLYEQLPGVRSDLWYCKLAALGGYFTFFLYLFGIIKMCIYDNSLTGMGILELMVVLIFEITIPCMLASNIAYYDVKLLHLNHVPPILRILIRFAMAVAAFIVGFVLEVSLIYAS